MSSSKQTTKLLLAIFAIILMAAEWILLVAGIRPHEMIVGLGSVLVSALFVGVVTKMSMIGLDFHLSDVAQGWRIRGTF